MCSLFRRMTGIAVVLLLCAAVVPASGTLRVCADPDALPFSNLRRQGFENRLAEMLARDLRTPIAYTWQRTGHGFVRNILNKSQCDVLLGIPSGFRAVLTTEPYYRSSYVFAARADSGSPITSFNDARLRHLRIGVQVIGEQYAPPAQALARRGMLRNIHGFTTTGTDRDAILRALLQGEIDIAVVWGPQAGYFDKLHGHVLTLTPVQPEVDVPALPMTFMISMGVRQRDTGLRDRLNRFIERDRRQIERLLRSYGVPLLPIGSGDGALAQASDAQS
jgi:mxaJ protein